MNIMVPNGVSGNWKVETFEVSEESAKFENMRSMFSHSSRGIEAGTYKRLTRNGIVVMSNTPAELGDHRYFVYIAKKCKNVLLNGLGLDVTLAVILESDIVENITVIEKSEDVINLVSSIYLKDSRVEIIHADALEYKPPKGIRYGAVWHDIWDNICEDNLPEMTKLKRKYGRRCDYQECWCENLCRR